MFNCNVLPSAVWAEWKGSFPCHCGNTGVERTPKKSQHRKVRLEKKSSPAASSGNRIRDLSTTCPSLCQLSYPGPAFANYSSTNPLDFDLTPSVGAFQLTLNAQLLISRQDEALMFFWVCFFSEPMPEWHDLPLSPLTPHLSTSPFTARTHVLTGM